MQQERLEEIDESHEAAWLAMIEDYRKNDPKTFEAAFKRKVDWTSAEFRKFAKEAQKERLDWRPGANKTSISRYVLLDRAGRICATGLMRFPLDEKTEVDGGNLVCEVPPSFRGQEFGAVCLSHMLFEAVRAGLRRVLVTCPADQASARKMVERNRGVLQDVVESTQPYRNGMKIARYWINFG